MLTADDEQEAKDADGNADHVADVQNGSAGATLGPNLKGQTTTATTAAKIAPRLSENVL